MRESESFLTATGRARVFTRRWMPADRQSGGVVLVHGIGEHSGRFSQVAEQLAGAGFAVSALDLRGHGRSSGRRGDTRFSPTLRDIDAVVEHERRRASDVPLFLYGHSLGGLLALAYVLDYRPALAGVVVTGPALHTALRAQRLRVAVARWLGRLLPGVTLPSGLDEALVNRDPAVVEEYRNDPLVHGRASLGFARDALAAIDRVLQGAPDFPLPLLIVHGGDDRINFVSGSREVAARHPGDRTLTVYDGLYHAIEHEPEHRQVVDHILQWMETRRAAATEASTTRLLAP